MCGIGNVWRGGGGVRSLLPPFLTICPKPAYEYFKRCFFSADLVIVKFILFAKDVLNRGQIPEKSKFLCVLCAFVCLTVCVCARRSVKHEVPEYTVPRRGARHGAKLWLGVSLKKNGHFITRVGNKNASVLLYQRENTGRCSNLRRPSIQVHLSLIFSFVFSFLNSYLSLWVTTQPKKLCSYVKIIALLIKSFSIYISYSNSAWSK